jgi:cytoskeletal protein CcmA (bactofilin family)
MWWEKEKKPRTVAPVPPIPKAEPAPQPTPILETPMPETTTKLPAPAAPGPQQTFLGRSVAVRGQFSGNENLLIEGQVEGTITLEDHIVTVGANGQVKAEIHARQVVVLGSVTGNITAREKVEIRRSGHVVGDLRAGAVAIEEGAYFKGSIDILREGGAESSRPVAASSSFEGRV